MAFSDSGTLTRGSGTPVAIDAGALAHLRFIRDTIEAAGTFTSVPGKGCVAMGLVALGAAALDALLDVTRGRLAIWLVAAPLAASLAVYFMVRKAREQGFPLWRSVARRFFLTLIPALAAGAVLTVALLRADSPELVPGAWLLLYGVGFAASGVFSLPCVSIAGFAFMALGTVACIVPAWSPALLAAGFGGLHIALGWLIIRRHGG
ncbi:MAG TPA: hypothetical protein VIN61_11835 [Gammaproteobacteria bacterium]